MFTYIYLNTFVLNLDGFIYFTYIYLVIKFCIYLLIVFSGVIFNNSKDIKQYINPDVHSVNFFFQVK